MKKSRFLYAHPDANPGKIASLEALQEVYADYLKVCVDPMLTGHRFSIALKDRGLNRSGTKFRCRYCGKVSHADVVGGMNLRGRSTDKEIQLDDHPSVVRPILMARHEAWRRRQASLSAAGRRNKALEPSSPSLTVEVPDAGISTDSNPTWRESA